MYLFIKLLISHLTAVFVFSKHIFKLYFQIFTYLTNSLIRNGAYQYINLLSAQ